MKSVHYLVRAVSGEDGLVYPTELDIKNYQAFGGFFLMGSKKDAPDDEYIFYAIRGNGIIKTTATRYQDSKSFFRINIENIGAFIFFTQPMPKKYPYIGSIDDLRGLFAIRKFCPLSPYVLDKANREHAFYFIGTSPRTR
jgi:hypothetical protein